MAYRLFKERLATLKLARSPTHIALSLTKRVRLEERQLDLFARTAGDERRKRVIDQAREKVQPGRALMGVIWDEPKARLPERRAHLQSLVEDQVTHPLCLPRPLREAPQIAQIFERWEVREEWWTGYPIARTYLCAQLKNGALQRLFIDRITGRWARQ